jgi:hypothetical protein
VTGRRDRKGSDARTTLARSIFIYEEIKVMVVNAIQHISALLPSILHGHDWTVVAQSVTDTDLMGTVQKAFAHFIKSGQGWALLIGVIIGYMFRSLTTYG